MGAGFLILIGGFFGALTTAGLVVVGWESQRNAGAEASLKSRFAVVVVPVILAAYTGIGFIGYAIWCEQVRQVDMGFGDSARVPVGNGYFFCITDGAAYLLRDGCTGSPAFDDITHVALANDRIIGLSKSKGAFVLDTRSGERRMFADIATATKELPEGSRPQVRAQRIEHFYWEERWGWPDIGALALIVVPGIAAFGLWLRLCFHLSPS